MEVAITTAIAGGIGGSIKSIIGWRKKNKKFNVKYFLTTLVEGMIGGIIIGFAVPSVPLAFFAGMGISHMADFNTLWESFKKG